MRLKYYHYKVKDLIKIKNIVTMHHFKLDKNFKSLNESHDFYEFVFCKRGSLQVKQDSKETLLNENEIIFHAPNVTHGIKADGISPVEIYIISFDSKSEQMSYFNNKKLKVPHKLITFLNMIFDVGSKTFDIDNTTPNTLKMELKYDAELGGIQSITNLLEFFLIELIKDQNEDELSFFINSNELVDSILEYLKNNIENQISIDEIANKFSYSKSYIFKEFKKVTKETIMSYYIKLKINAAKEYLRKTDKSINEIAAILKFSDTNYFIKVFKKITKTTPKKYRLSLR